MKNIFDRASVKSGVDFLVDHFQSTFPRAKDFQVKIDIFKNYFFWKLNL